MNKRVLKPHLSVLHKVGLIWAEWLMRKIKVLVGLLVEPLVGMGYYLGQSRAGTAQSNTTLPTLRDLENGDGTPLKMPACQHS